MNHPELHQKTYLLLLTIVTLAFGWILWPFYGALFWAAVIAILFEPLYRQLLTSMRQRRNLAALTTLLLFLIIVIFPLALVTAVLAREANAIYQQMHSGKLDYGAYFQQVISALPPWITSLLDRFDMGDITSIQKKLSAVMMQGSQLIATQALNVGQNTFEFIVSFGIMLYVMYFLLRDGRDLTARIRQAIPLGTDTKRYFFSKFTTVIRATVKGNIVVAIVQGAFGGIMFWFLGIQAPLLWGTVMAFLSLLPAVGTAMVWGPVAIYLLVTGEILQGLIMLAFGVLVIGLVDNVLRPVLVGKDTQMPDYVVLVSTLGGMATFGLHGFVIGPVIAALFIAAWDLFSTERGTPPDDPV
ncbi:MAG TPA: AI-2E family transporter [Noviherbaspirillum sp.]|uniref:AI-2E family transporter n=1 Tax=Noviherbaspirillum sp. TaxID=1926288 RepID=UPI002B471C5F|nr:AI-2E family transporter [Noviherbaspirillum sp.]HJV85250.1 AI-2E family transporter [Noviherbaspirillum sp.]